MSWESAYRPVVLRVLAGLFLLPCGVGAMPPELVKCDQIMSGYEAGLCAEEAYRAGEPARAARLREVASRFPARAAVAVLAVNSAAAAYISYRIDHEVDLTGTASSLVQVNERLRLEEEHRADLVLLASGRQLPAGMAAAAPRRVTSQVGAEGPAAKGSAQEAEAQAVSRDDTTWRAYLAAWARLVVMVRGKREVPEWTARLQARRAANVERVGFKP